MAEKPVQGLDADLAEKAAAKYDPKREQEAREYIETVTGEKFSSDDFQASLKDGVLLCKLMNIILPSDPIKISTSRIAFKQMENIAFFLQRLPKIGVPAYEQFQTVDLYEGKNIDQVINCIFSLSRHAAAKGFNGPILGPKLVTKVERNFSEETLNQSKSILPRLTNFVAKVDGPGPFGGRREIGGVYLDGPSTDGGVDAATEGVSRVSVTDSAPAASATSTTAPTPTATVAAPAPAPLPEPTPVVVPEPEPVPVPEPVVVAAPLPPAPVPVPEPVAAPEPIPEPTYAPVAPQRIAVPVPVPVPAAAPVEPPAPAPAAPITRVQDNPRTLDSAFDKLDRIVREAEEEMQRAKEAAAAARKREEEERAAYKARLAAYAPPPPAVVQTAAPPAPVAAEAASPSAIADSYIDAYYQEDDEEVEEVVIVEEDDGDEGKVMYSSGARYEE
ncbi:Muscle-specific protein 20 [Phlyctochytrium bullatum]|nr:Muscle-specific protein 20 [Phlyctochytrium bullatum]